MRRSKLSHMPFVVAAAFVIASCQGKPTSEPGTAVGKDAKDANEAPAAAAAEEFRELTIPTGTSITVSLDDSVGSATSRVDDAVRAHVTKPVSVSGVVAVPVGSQLSGAVVEAQRSGRVKGLAEVAVHFDKLRPAADGETYTIHTVRITRTAKSEKKKDAAKVGIGAGAGAAIGAILGGGKGAAIGAGVGAGGGAAYVMSERGQEISIARGAMLTVKLTEPISVRVRSAAATN